LMGGWGSPKIVGQVFLRNVLNAAMYAWMVGDPVAGQPELTATGGRLV